MGVLNLTEPCVAQGLLLAKGPGVMKGYYNDEASTARAFVAGDGWFDTGDLGWRAPSERIWFSHRGPMVLITLCVQSPLECVRLSQLLWWIDTDASAMCCKQRA